MNGIGARGLTEAFLIFFVDISIFDTNNDIFENRETNVDPLPCCKQRVEEQKC